jgi:hypothetical protein
VTQTSEIRLSALELKSNGLGLMIPLFIRCTPNNPVDSIDSKGSINGIRNEVTPSYALRKVDF